MRGRDDPIPACCDAQGIFAVGIILDKPTLAALQCALVSPPPEALFPMTDKNGLDRIDLQILDILQRDGRLPFQRLSEQVNLTPRPCLERVRRLEKAGIIKGYSAIVDLPRSTPPLVILAQVTLADHLVSQQAFIAEIQRTPQVQDGWMVSGTVDFLLRIACQHIDEYRQLADAWLASTAFRIEKILTTTELQTIKRDGRSAD